MKKLYAYKKKSVVTLHLWKMNFLLSLFLNISRHLFDYTSLFMCKIVQASLSYNLTYVQFLNFVKMVLRSFKIRQLAKHDNIHIWHHFHSQIHSTQI